MVATLLVGVVIGVLGSIAILSVADTHTNKNTTKIHSKPRTKAQQSARQKSIDERYTLALKKVERDLNAGKITQEQADLINKKLLEIAQYQKRNAAQIQSPATLQEQHQAWRKWAQSNNINPAYLSRMY